MATLLRHVVDDIASDMKQMFDDKIIQKTQIAYWVLIVGNRLKSQHIGKRDSGAFLSTFVDVPVEMKKENKNPNQVKNRKFFFLPKSIYDYHKDGAISYISYYIEEQKPGCPPPFTNVAFNRTTPSKARRIYFNKYEEPTPDHPYFYRVGDYIYLLGLEKVNVKFIEVGLFTTLDPVTEIDLDQPFDFPEELLIILKRQVLDLGRFSLLIPEERINDGNDGINTGAVPTNKLVSVNELNQDQTENK